MIKKERKKNNKIKNNIRKIRRKKIPKPLQHPLVRMIPGEEYHVVQSQHARWGFHEVLRRIDVITETELLVLLLILWPSGGHVIAALLARDGFVFQLVLVKICMLYVCKRKDMNINKLTLSRSM